MAPQTPYAKPVAKAPFQKKEQIVIIGGGPAGVHMAAQLCKRGYKNVTILEAGPDVGGKSYTLTDDRGVPHEMGTCYLHFEYNSLRGLLAEYDPSNKEVPVGKGYGNRRVFGTDLRQGDDGNFTHGIDFGEYVLSRSEEATVSPGCWALCWDPVQALPIFIAMTKYMDLHRKILGEYEYGLMPRPRNFADVDMTAMDFLKKHDLEAMIGFLRYTQQVQGYGILEHIPALYLLWWHHYDLIKTTIEQTVRREQDNITMVTKGYQSLWRSMAKKHQAKDGLKVVTNAAVASVTRGESGPGKGKCTVVYRDASGEEKTLKPDKVIFAANMRTFKSSITDLTPQEAEIFNDLASVTLTTTLYEASKVDHEHTVELWFSRMQPGPDGQESGRLYAHRNSRLAIDQKSKPPPGGRERRVAYQFYNRPPQSGDAETLQAQLLKDLAISGEKDVTIMHQALWDYFPHFSNENLKKGHLWNVLAMQGQRNCAFVGSSVCFESVLDVVAYNNLLLKYLKL